MRTMFLQGRNVTDMAGGSWRELGDLRAGERQPTRIMSLRRLFGLDDDQIEGVLGGRQVDTGFTQTGVYAKVAARLRARTRTSRPGISEATRTDVRGYKDLWGGLGRLQSDFDPQRLQLLLRAVRAARTSAASTG